MDKIQSLEKCGEKLVSELYGLKKSKQIFDAELDNQNLFDLQNAKFENIINIVANNEGKMSFICQNKDVLSKKLGVIENKNGKS